MGKGTDTRGDLYAGKGVWPRDVIGAMTACRSVDGKRHCEVIPHDFWIRWSLVALTGSLLHPIIFCFDTSLTSYDSRHRFTPPYVNRRS